MLSPRGTKKATNSRHHHERHKPQLTKWHARMSADTSHKPHASSRPSLFSHTHSFTAQIAWPQDPPHTQVPTRHQHWHRKASIVTQSRLTRDNQPTPAVHFSIPPLQHHRNKLHCLAHKCIRTKRWRSLHTRYAQKCKWDAAAKDLPTVFLDSKDGLFGA